MANVPHTRASIHGLFQWVLEDEAKEIQEIFGKNLKISHEMWHTYGTTTHELVLWLPLTEKHYYFKNIDDLAAWKKKKAILFRKFDTKEIFPKWGKKSGN